MNLDLLSRDWWKKLTFDQVQKILIGQNVCLYGLLANPTFSVGIDQVQRLSADFEIICSSDSIGKNTGVIKIDLTFVDFKSTNLLFKKLVSLSESDNPYIWIKGTVINSPQITIRVYGWGQAYEDLEVSKDIENKK